MGNLLSRASAPSVEGADDIFVSALRSLEVINSVVGHDVTLIRLAKTIASLHKKADDQGQITGCGGVVVLCGEGQTETKKKMAKIAGRMWAHMCGSGERPAKRISAGMFSGNASDNYDLFRLDYCVEKTAVFIEGVKANSAVNLSVHKNLSLIQQRRVLILLEVDSPAPITTYKYGNKGNAVTIVHSIFLRPDMQAIELAVKGLWKDMAPTRPPLSPDTLLNAMRVLKNEATIKKIKRFIKCVLQDLVKKEETEDSTQAKKRRKANISVDAAVKSKANAFSDANNNSAESHNGNNASSTSGNPTHSNNPNNSNNSNTTATTNIHPHTVKLEFDPILEAEFHAPLSMAAPESFKTYSQRKKEKSLNLPQEYDTATVSYLDSVRNAKGFVDTISCTVAKLRSQPKSSLALQGGAMLAGTLSHAKVVPAVTAPMAGFLHLAAKATTPVAKATTPVAKAVAPAKEKKKGEKRSRSNYEEEDHEEHSKKEENVEQVVLEDE